jgi:hypothetical protein
VSTTERILAALKNLLLLQERIEGFSGKVERLSGLAEGLDRRLLKVEATLEYATKGGFRPHQPDPPALPTNKP